MFSARFQREIVVTHHARLRMLARGVDDAVVLDVIDTGTARWKDDVRLWLFKEYDGRDDNLICVVAVLESVLVVKTVMHHFVEGEPP